jgi:hypothetical protein
VRRARVLLLCALGLCALGAAIAGPASAAGAEGDAGATSATIVCPSVAAPGRVRCDVEVHVPEGETIAWGDVVLVRVAPFASALRGRIGPHDASVREPRVWQWPFAVVAREKGKGIVEGRVRLVVCRAGVCATRTIEVSGGIDVGS